MAFEMLVGLAVNDQDRYAAYRAAMSPVLARIGGGFGYDFQVDEVLTPPEARHLNRVFTIWFPDEAAKDEFFADPEYVAAKEAHFEAAVDDTVVISSYVRQPAREIRS